MSPLPRTLFNEGTWVTGVEGTWVTGLEESIPEQLLFREGADELPAVVDAQLGVVFLHPDVVAGDAAADEDAVAAEADLAAGVDLAGDLPRLVGRLRERRGSPPFAGPPALDGRPVAQGLVGPEGVVDGAPAFGVLVEVGAGVPPRVEE